MSTIRRTVSLLALGALTVLCPGARAAAPSAVARPARVSRPKLSSNATAADLLSLAGPALAPLRFEPNVGQASARTRLVARGIGVSAALGRDEVAAGTPGDAPLTFRFAGASPRVRLAPERRLACETNYLVGDASRHRTGLETYGAARYAGVYDGVDAVVTGSGSDLSCAFEISPGADPSRVRLTFGSPARRDASGALAVGTTPVRLDASQTVDGVAKPVAARFVVDRHGEVSVAVGGYEPSLALTVRAVLAYSTFYGGASGGTIMNDAAFDNLGQLTIVGSVTGTDLPFSTLPGIPFQAASGGGSDAFVCKIDPYRGELLRATYLGGSGDDFGNTVVCSVSGGTYVVGSTSSANFPVTSSQPASVLQGPTDGFVTELDAGLARLFTSRYVGGTGDDALYDIGINPTASSVTTEFVTFAGETTSTDLPILNALQVNNGGGKDAFVGRLGSFLTYLGGSGDDTAYGVAVDATGRAVVTGATASTNFPTQSPIQAAKAGGQDAFVSRYDLNLGTLSLDFSTYLGGSGTDVGKSATIDASGDVIVAGESASTNFPTHSPLQAANAGGVDTTVTELSPAGTSVLFSTYLGGSGDETTSAVLAGTGGHVFVVGSTASSNFPTANGFQAASGGGTDAYVARYDLSPTPSLAYATYLGGGGTDAAHGIVLDANGAAIVVGSTTSADFPLVTPFDSTIGAGKSFVVRVASPSGGADSIGTFDSQSSFFSLKNANAGGNADILAGFGAESGGAVGIAGDWNGDGTSTIGLYVPATGTFFLRNTSSPGLADLTFTFGAANAGYIPVVGDWNGDGVDTIGLYQPASGVFFLKNTNTYGPADVVFGYGPGGASVPITGDWNGDGTDTIGVYFPASGSFYLRNSNSPGNADVVVNFGAGGAGYVPLAGDWNGDGVDTIGLYQPATSGWFLRDSNTGGAADLTFVFASPSPSATPLVGDWDGL